MKKLLLACSMMICIMALFAAAIAETSLPDCGLTVAFPEGWSIVIPETVSMSMQYFDEATPDEALLAMQRESIQAMAFAPAGDLVIRVVAHQEDDVARQYYDIDRYTPAMRTSIKDRYLDRMAWTATGFRYTEAEWSNRQDQGRILNLVYNIRNGEEITYRGRQAYTVRNGWTFVLDIRAQGRRLTTDEERAFTAFVASAAFPESVDVPPMPTGLTIKGTLPEETYKADVSLRGTTTKGATVSAYLLPDEGDPIHMGSDNADSGGEFRVDFQIPSSGDWRLYIKSELEGYQTTEEAAWISYYPRRIPVTFTSYPTGDVYDSQIVISGTTISGVTIQCMEGDTNKKVKTGSGDFSFTLDRTAMGERTVILSFSKKDFDNRRYEIVFNRQMEREDYAKMLDSQVQSLSFANLTENAEKYLGRLVKYSGEVLRVSSAEGMTYVQLGVKQDKEGNWTEQIIAVADNVAVSLYEGDKATVYFEVTGDFYGFPSMTSEGEQEEIELPAVKLLTYLTT